MDNEVIITKELKDEILKRTRQTPKYMKLAAAFQQHQSHGQYMQAQFIAKQMKTLEEYVKQEVIKHYKYEKREMSSIIDPMTDEDKAAMNVWANSLIMMSDIIEVIISEMNQTIKKYFPDMHLTSFNDLNRFGQEAKKQVAFFDNTYKDEKTSFLFGSTSDKLYEMIVNKVKSFTNKVNQHADRINKKNKRNTEVA